MKRRKKRNDVEISTNGMVLNGFTQIRNDLFVKITNEINCQSLCVYLALLSHRNATTKKCFPSVKLISEKCNLSETTVRRCTKALVDIGVLKIVKSSTSRVNSYEFPMEEDKKINV